MLQGTKDQQLDTIVKEIADAVDITKEQYESAVRSYNFVGDYLCAPDSPLAPYKPKVLPQGSFMLGTTIRPLLETDQLDIDLVCRLTGKAPSWTPYDLKKIVGDRLKSHGTFERMLDEEGRRCWTLNYADSRKFHMDILPALVGLDYEMVLNRAFSSYDLESLDGLAIRITDKEWEYHRSEQDPQSWMKSNPFGYAKWFHVRCSTPDVRMLSEKVDPVKPYSSNKPVLVRVVQILKRHRDIMFKGDKHKPISIIITTLAARAYGGEIHLLSALQAVISGMKRQIELRYNPDTGKAEKWVPNPVNEEENFADKWTETPKKEANFYRWLDELEKDFLSLERISVTDLQPLLTKSFGQNVVTEAFNRYGETLRKQREGGNLRMEAKSGMLGAAAGSIVKNHNFYGKEK
jgi:hypothetical protein